MSNCVEQNKVPLMAKPEERCGAVADNYTQCPRRKVPGMNAPSPVPRPRFDRFLDQLCLEQKDISIKILVGYAVIKVNLN